MTAPRIAKEPQKKQNKNKNTESLERHEDEKCRWKYPVKAERCGGRRRRGGGGYLATAATGLTWGYAAKWDQVTQNIHQSCRIIKGRINMWWGLISCGNTSFITFSDLFLKKKKTYLWNCSFIPQFHNLAVWCFLILALTAQLPRADTLCCERPVGWLIERRLIIWPRQLKSCENCLASTWAGVPHESISGGVKANVKQRIYSSRESKCWQSHTHKLIQLSTVYCFFFYSSFLKLSSKVRLHF